jgi:hypothetical protein
MQRRDFIAAVGVVAASAVSQSNPIYAQPIGAVAHRTVLAIISISPNRATDRESDSGWSASYAALSSSRANNTNSEAVRGSLWSRCPPLFDERRHSIHTVTICKYRRE